MKIDSKDQEGLVIITPDIKRLDVTTCDEFKNEIISIMQKEKKMIILNLSHIDFIDSRGLGSLISIFKEITNKGWLGLCEATNNVLDLFKLTRMDRLFDIYVSEKEAIQSGIHKKELFDK